MNELINIQKRQESFRHNLLTNVSLLALAGTIYALPSAAEENRSTVWIELGGQLERVDAAQSVFTPAFFDLAPTTVANTMVDAQRPSRYSIGGEGRITIVPKASDWVLLAAIRYGQVKNPRHLHYETPGLPSFFNYKNGVKNANPVVPSLRMFGDGQTHSAESHFVLDFQAGKDVGLGLLGNDASSIFSAGVRYTQFTARSDVTLHARPVVGYGPLIGYSRLGKYYQGHKAFHQTYNAAFHATRSTHAIGPSVSWNASMPVLGDGESMTVAFDWGANGALLFGRQRSLVSHNTTGAAAYFIGTVAHARNYMHATDHARMRSIIIPNAGGYANISLKFPNAKVSLGYRGDFFFNATDSGIEVRDAANQNFYGPFATISIGLGG